MGRCPESSRTTTEGTQRETFGHPNDLEAHSPVRPRDRRTLQTHVIDFRVNFLSTTAQCSGIPNLTTPNLFCLVQCPCAVVLMIVGRCPGSSHTTTEGTQRETFGHTHDLEAHSFVKARDRQTLQTHVIEFCVNFLSTAQCSGIPNLTTPNLFCLVNALVQWSSGLLHFGIVLVQKGLVDTHC